MFKVFFSGLMSILWSDQLSDPDTSYYVGSGSGKIIPLRKDPDPQHFQTLKLRVDYIQNVFSYYYLFLNRI